MRAKTKNKYSSPLAYSDYPSYRSELEKGSLSVVNEVERILVKIDQSTHLNAFIEVFAADARARASVIDQKIAHKTAGRLAGMVIALKDNLCLRDHKLSASSKILEGFQSLFTGTAVERLLAEDAIIIGRTNCDEFAMGSSNLNSAFGPVLNPLDNTRVPGGSSGGSAAALAAGLCHASLGSDTGGSIRQPASFTGLWGLKPTYGRISRHGLIAYASSFDQIGPFALNAIDTALLLEIMAGKDDYDSTCSEQEVPSYSTLIENTQENKRFAVFKSVLNHKGLDPAVHADFHQQIEQLKSKGHTVEEVNFDYLDYLVPIYYLLTTAEASSNLARFDGVHYGFRDPNATEPEEVYKKSRTKGFGKEVKRRILLGTFVLSSGYYDAYYGNAQRARRLVTDYVNDLFKNFDFILSPTTPHEAFRLDRKDADPTVMYLEDIFTVLANICGLPAISVPTGLGSSNMPLGTQLIGKAFSEAELIQTARQLG